jgi:hypothetical protein
MKKYQVTNFIFNPSTKCYDVWFGNRICVSFSSKRDMAKFMAETNKFLQSKMVELNDIFCKVFYEYRQIWFTQIGNTNQPLSEMHIQKLITDILMQFDRICYNSVTTTQSGWAFIALQNICLMLDEAIKIISILNKKRNNTIQYHNINILGNRVIILQNELQQYPAEKPQKARYKKDNK